MTAFDPLFRNPHLQTLAGHFWKRPNRFPVERRLIQTEPGVQVLVESQRPEGNSRGDLVLVHGLEGSGESGYMRGLSAAAVLAGYSAHRFHMRTCGGTERLSPTLYHAGLTSDLLAVLRQMRAEGAGPVFLAGFSLGGNVVVKLAAELGGSARSLIRGVCGVSAALDLEASSERIGQPDNRFYEARFVRRMRARLCATGRYGQSDFSNLRTVKEIDDRITAPSFGFADANEYYRTQSAVRYLARLCAPVLLIQARDDTFVPFSIFESEQVRANPCIRVLATEHGGHLGFIGRAPRRFWAEDALLEWIGALSSPESSWIPALRPDGGSGR